MPAFLALGGYAMGMHLTRQIGTRGVDAHPFLPDFMVFLNYKELPFFWYGFNWFPNAALMVLLVPGTLAFVFGSFAFRSRVTSVYLSIIAQALLRPDARLLPLDFGSAATTAPPTSRSIVELDVQFARRPGHAGTLSAVALGSALW